MNFGENLQTLRKKRGLSQEELADKMDVSRQAVSKWESGTGYPETEKLITISNVLNCSLDELVRGKVSKDEQTDRETYDSLMDKVGKNIAFGVFIILVGLAFFFLIQEVTVGLVKDSNTFALIVLMFFVMGAVPIFIVNGMNLETYKRKYRCLPNFYTAEEREEAQKKTAMTIALSVSIIIFGVILFLATAKLPNLGEDSAIPMVVLFGCLALSVPNLVRTGIAIDKYDIEKYNREHSSEFVKGEELVSKISAVIMITATIIYFVISFVFELWNLSWIIFPIAGMLCGIVSVILGDNR